VREMLRFIAKRLALVPIQAVGVTIITFFLVRLLPGNPAQQLAGPFGTPSVIASISKRLGLSKPIWTQYWLYLDNVIHFNLGTSFTTGRPVASDIGTRLPATLELITCALIVIVVLGIGLGTLIATRGGGIADRVSFVYGLLGGAFPDFWFGLVAVYLFFFELRWLPAPLGQLSISYATPPRVTGFVVIDSLLHGDIGAFGSALSHLILPVLTLVFVYMGPILKMTRSRLRDMLESDFAEHARAMGFDDRAVLRYALRSSLPPVVTLVGVTYSFLLGGAVLVETIFSWGGLGQYAVDAVRSSDYAAIQGVILVAAIFNLIVYLVVDIIDRLIDPRIALAAE